VNPNLAIIIRLWPLTAILWSMALLRRNQVMPSEPSSLATMLFAAGAVLPFLVVVACAVLGLVKR
jgi:hypothetical protein